LLEPWLQTDYPDMMEMIGQPVGRDWATVGRASGYLVPRDDISRPFYVTRPKPPRAPSPFVMPNIQVRRRVNLGAGFEPTATLYDVQTGEYGFIGRFTSSIEVGVGNESFVLEVESFDYATLTFQSGARLRPS